MTYESSLIVKNKLGELRQREKIEGTYRQQGKHQKCMHVQRILVNSNIPNPSKFLIDFISEQ